MDLNKAKATIRQLLNVANDDAAAKGEIENAMRFAAKLMEQHQLSDDDLSAVDDVLLNLERAEMAREFAFVGGAKLSEWETDCASFACSLVGGVKHYMLKRPALVRSSAGIIQLDAKGEEQFKPRIAFYGIAEDVEIARELFTELIVTIAAMARLKWGGVYRGSGRNYCEGFVSALFDKLHADRRTAKLEAQELARIQSEAFPGQDQSRNALAIIENRQSVVVKKAELSERYAKETLKLKFSHSQLFSYGKSYNGDAHADGKRDGQRHNANVVRHRKLTSQ